jgi:hypothetical protein
MAFDIYGAYMSVLYVAYMSNVIMFHILCAYTFMYACIYVQNMSDIYDIWHIWCIYASAICGIYVKCHYVSYIVRLYVHVCVHICVTYEWHIWHLTYMVHICQCYMWHICQMSLCLLYCALIRACMRAYMCKIWVTYMTFDIHGTYMSILYM